MNPDTKPLSIKTAILQLCVKLLIYVPVPLPVGPIVMIVAQIYLDYIDGLTPFSNSDRDSVPDETYLHVGSKLMHRILLPHYDFRLVHVVSFA